MSCVIAVTVTGVKGHQMMAVAAAEAADGAATRGAAWDITAALEARTFPLKKSCCEYLCCFSNTVALIGSLFCLDDLKTGICRWKPNSE